MDRRSTGLNAEQRRAAEAVRGPVCILAGAGSGKTTTITRRHRAAGRDGRVRRRTQIMAVTFTDKAARRAEGAARSASARRGVRASTFHSAALRQLRHFAPERRRADPAVEGARCCARSRTACRRRTSSGRRATSRPRSSGRRTAASVRRLRATAGDREPPIPLDLMQRVYRDYERRKAAEGRDRLRGPARARGPAVRGATRPRARRSGRSTARSPSTSTRTSTCSSRRCSTCGSASATTSASSATTTSRSTRSPARARSTCSACRSGSRRRSSSGSRRTTARRRRCSRSRTGSCRSLGGAEKTLRPTRADGPEPVRAAVRDAGGRGRRDRRPRSARSAAPLEEMAILCAHERAADRLRGAAATTRGIPFQGASLLERDAARRLLPAARAVGGAPAAEAVRAAALEAGWLSGCPTSSASASSCARHDLARLVALAAAFDGDAAAFVAELRRALRPGRRRRARRPPAHAPPREGARVRGGLPAAAAGEGAAVEAGAHRRGARRGAASALRRPDARAARCSGSRGRASRRASWPSSGVARASRRRARARPRLDAEPARGCASGGSSARRRTACRRTSSSTTRVLHAIADARPASLGELAQISGVGPAKLERYGDGAC